MKRMRTTQGMAVALACLGMMLPNYALAGGFGPADDAGIQIHDVALAAGGVLNGQVVDPAGAPIIHAEVAILRQGQLVQQTTTDVEGRFAATGLRGGVYHVTVGQTQAIYRVWAADTAPPSAQHGVLVVASGDDLVRGQGPIRYYLSNPWVIGGIVATAIAVPVALSRSKKSKS